jgi:hypothetical protein
MILPGAKIQQVSQTGALFVEIFFINDEINHC